MATQEKNQGDTKIVENGKDLTRSTSVVIEEVPGRAVWGKQLEFILTMVGYAVGLGNVWRFPYLCYKNGGGAFLVPYCLCLIFLGIPVFGLEVSFGQFGGRGPISIWGLSPSFKGVGYAAVLTTVLVAIYYNVIIAWALYYLVASFTLELPWSMSLCNDCRCLIYASKNASEVISGAIYANDNDTFSSNVSRRLNCSGYSAKDAMSPSEIYFNEVTLNKTSGIAEAGDFQIHLVIANLVGWAVVLGVLSKGIQTLGKVVYVTSTFPYVLLTILLVKCTMLEGAYDGIIFYLVPDWSRLADANVWSDAAVQIFFSLSACQGGLIALSSYNKFDNNVLRDSLLVPIINCMTSFYAGFVVFSVLGYMANLRGVSVAEVTQGGPGLAFVVYPEAVTQMPISPLWAILFFIMVVMLGFSTAFSAVETIMTSFIDEFPHRFGSKKQAFIFRIFVCVAGFLLGLPMVTQGGSYLLDIVDSYVVGYPTLFVGLFELVIIAWIYGAKEFTKDIKAMIQRGPYKFYVICWVFISPVLLIAVIVFKAYQYVPLTASTTLYYPWWAEAIGWGCALFPLVFIPAWFYYYICYGGLWEKLKELHQPQESWTSRRQLSVMTETAELDGEVNELQDIDTTLPPSPTTDYKDHPQFLPPYKVDGRQERDRDTEDKEHRNGVWHLPGNNQGGGDIGGAPWYYTGDRSSRAYANVLPISLPRYFREVPTSPAAADGGTQNYGVYTYTVREDLPVNGRPPTNAYDNRGYETMMDEEDGEGMESTSPRSSRGPVY